MNGPQTCQDEFFGVKQGGETVRLDGKISEIAAFVSWR